MEDFINLPYGGQFSVQQLIDQTHQLGGTIIIGHMQRTLHDHSKPYSLDYWLRTHGASHPDTKQVIRALVDDLVATGHFERVRVRDTNTDRVCSALRLVRLGALTS